MEPSDLQEKLHQLRKQNAELRASQSRQLKKLENFKNFNQKQAGKIKESSEQDIKDFNYIRQLEKQLNHCQFEFDKLNKENKRRALGLRKSQEKLMSTREDFVKLENLLVHLN